MSIRFRSLKASYCKSRIWRNRYRLIDRNLLRKIFTIFSCERSTYRAFNAFISKKISSSMSFFSRRLFLRTTEFSAVVRVDVVFILAYDFCFIRFIFNSVLFLVSCTRLTIFSFSSSVFLRWISKSCWFWFMINLEMSWVWLRSENSELTRVWRDMITRNVRVCLIRCSKCQKNEDKRCQWEVNVDEMKNWSWILYLWAISRDIDPYFIFEAVAPRPSNNSTSIICTVAANLVVFLYD
jgi:hypothetical protein